MSGYFSQLTSFGRNSGSVDLRGVWQLACCATVVRLSAFALLLLSSAYVQAQSQRQSESGAQTQSDRPVISQSVQYPHSNGYQLGDRFEHILLVEMRRPYNLVADSLPAAGRVSAYIDLQDITVKKNRKFASTVYKIILRYQVINYDDGLVGTNVPPAIVTFATDIDVYPVVIERWGLTLSPFLLKEPRNDGAMPSLENLTDVTRIPLLGRVLACMALLVCGVVLLLPAIRNTLINPLKQKRNQPFIQAHRKITILTRDNTLSSFESALRCLHDAFNKKLGRTVLSDDIDLFVNHFPKYGDSRKDIERFFSLSDQHFFGRNSSRSEDIRQNTSFVMSLSTVLRRIEWTDRSLTEPRQSSPALQPPPKKAQATGNNQTDWLMR